jgi:hypothetical protein
VHFDAAQAAAGGGPGVAVSARTCAEVTADDRRIFWVRTPDKVRLRNGSPIAPLNLRRADPPLWPGEHARPLGCPKRHRGQPALFGHGPEKLFRVPNVLQDPGRFMDDPARRVTTTSSMWIDELHNARNALRKE